MIVIEYIHVQRHRPIESCDINTQCTIWHVPTDMQVTQQWTRRRCNYKCLVAWWTDWSIFNVKHKHACSRENDTALTQPCDVSTPCMILQSRQICKSYKNGCAEDDTVNVCVNVKYELSEFLKCFHNFWNIFRNSENMVNVKLFKFIEHYNDLDTFSEFLNFWISEIFSETKVLKLCH